MTGMVWALIGAAFAIIGGGLGSAIGVSYASRAASGVISEDPEKFGKLFIFQLLPSSNVLYGFVIALVVFSQTILSSDVNAAGLTMELGLKYFAVCLPITVVGFLSSITQAKVCVSCINMVGKNEELSGRGIMLAALIEIVTLLSLVVSIFGILFI